MSSLLFGVSLFLAAGLGALSRLQVQNLIPINDRGLPIATLLVNLLGCFLIGFCFHYLEVRGVSQQVKVLVIGGFLGSFTTFSAYSLELFSLFSKGESKLAILYILLSTILGIGLVYLGSKISKTMTH